MKKLVGSLLLLISLYSVAALVFNLSLENAAVTVPLAGLFSWLGLRLISERNQRPPVKIALTPTADKVGLTTSLAVIGALVILGVSLLAYDGWRTEQTRLRQAEETRLAQQAQQDKEKEAAYQAQIQELLRQQADAEQAEAEYQKQANMNDLRAQQAAAQAQRQAQLNEAASRAADFVRQQSRQTMDYPRLEKTTCQVNFINQLECYTD